MLLVALACSSSAVSGRVAAGSAGLHLRENNTLDSTLDRGVRKSVSLAGTKVSAPARDFLGTGIPIIREAKERGIVYMEHADNCPYSASTFTMPQRYAKITRPALLLRLKRSKTCLRCVSTVLGLVSIRSPISS